MGTRRKMNGVGGIRVLPRSTGRIVIAMWAAGACVAGCSARQTDERVRDEACTSVPARSPVQGVAGSILWVDGKKAVISLGERDGVELDETVFITKEDVGAFVGQGRIRDLYYVSSVIEIDFVSAKQGPVRAGDAVFIPAQARL